MMQTPQGLVEQAKLVIKEISIDEAEQQLSVDSAICLIDVREADEFNQVHLSNALHIPRGVLEFRIAANVSDVTTPIFLYCRTGGRSALAAQSLQTLGYQNVVSVAGGITAWVEAGKAVVKPL